MKKIILTFGLLVCFLLSSIMTYADTFVETIADVSATDAVVVQNNELFASNYNTGQVFRIALDGTFSEVLGTNSRGPAGIRFDSSGNMYIAMYNINSIIKIDLKVMKRYLLIISENPSPGLGQPRKSLC